MTHDLEIKLSPDGTPYAMCRRCGLTVAADEPIAALDARPCAPPRVRPFAVGAHGFGFINRDEIVSCDTISSQGRCADCAVGG